MGFAAKLPFGEILDARTRSYCGTSYLHVSVHCPRVLDKLSQQEGFFADDVKIDENFRLWLTSMPCSYFPVCRSTTRSL